MPSSPSTDASTDVFVCDCKEWWRLACKGLPFYKEHEGKRYCVFHYPGQDKVADFNEALRKKLEEAWRNFNRDEIHFCGVWFPDAVTFGLPFSSVDFGSATFSAKASFQSASFKGDAYFAFATFCAEVSFDSAWFEADVDFYSASFKDSVSFARGGGGHEVFGDNSFLRLQFARIEKPDRFSFHTLKLRPHWFINVDARKFEFINVNWNWDDISTKGEIQSIREIGDADKLGDALSRHRLLAIACRNLAVNAEENHRYEEASRFRYMAMETRRLESQPGFFLAVEARQLGSWRGFAPLRLSWWYWLASGYGERVWRAFVVLVVVWLVAAALYTQVGFVRWEPRVSSEQEAWEAKRDEVGQPLRWQRALTYSLGVMTLQKPEPRPATDAAQAVVMLETILGPVQAALLALAIRRKFMR